LKRAMEAYETAAGWFENDNAEAYAYPTPIRTIMWTMLTRP
jgi:hypothetical protein